MCRRQTGKSIASKVTYKVCETKQPLNSLSSYKEGLFYVQDKASCFATEAADPKEGSNVFDICAAPGAKTTYLAQQMRNNGDIYSVDFSAEGCRRGSWKLTAWEPKLPSLLLPAHVSACHFGRSKPDCSGSAMHGHRDLRKTALSQMAHHFKIYQQNGRYSMANDQQLRGKSGGGGGHDLFNV